MPRPASDNDAQVALRLPEGWLARADALAPRVRPAGFAVTRSDVLRAAIARGLEALEAEVAR